MQISLDFTKILPEKKTFIAVVGGFIGLGCSYLGVGDPALVNILTNGAFLAAIAFLKMGENAANKLINEKLDGIVFPVVPEAIPVADVNPVPAVDNIDLTKLWDIVQELIADKALKAKK